VWSATHIYQTLREFGYVTSHAHYYIKPKKVFKHAQSPFISQVQPGAWFFKDPDMLKALPFNSSLDDNKELFLKERTNILEVTVPPAQIDDQGKKVMDCEQDIHIVEHFYNCVKSVIATDSIAYLAGDGVGWAVLPLIGKPINLLVTEKNAETFKYLLQKYVYFDMYVLFRCCVVFVQLLLPFDWRQKMLKN
jgi:hypothetical protein